MGYSTQFEGVLKFTTKLTVKQLAKLNRVLGEDVRDFPAELREEFVQSDNYYHIDLKLAEDFDGIVWNGAEKTYYMSEIIKDIITYMRTYDPNFGLVGTFKCQGEEIDDRYNIIVNGNDVRVVELHTPMTECPECGHRWETPS